MILGPIPKSDLMKQACSRASWGVPGKVSNGSETFQKVSEGSLYNSIKVI